MYMGWWFYVEVVGTPPQFLSEVNFFVLTGGGDPKT